MATGGKRRIDRILNPSYLGGIGDAPIEELRAKRAECEEEESVLSYERRLIHARIAIIEAEKERRSSGGSTKSLIDRLPEILAGQETPSHRGAFPNLEAPPISDHPRRRVEKLVTNDTLARLPDLTEAQMDEALSALRAAEGEVSEARRAVQAVLDPLVEEIGRRVGADV